MRAPQVAVVDNDSMFAETCCNAIRAVGLSVEYVTSDARFRELARAGDRILLVMDYLYKGTGEPPSDFQSYLNATGLLKETSSDHKRKARVVLVSKLISHPDPYAVSQYASVVDHLSKEEWRREPEACAARIWRAVLTSPSIARGYFSHLSPTACVRLVEHLLGPFAEEHRLKTKKRLLASLGYLEENDEIATLAGIGNWLSAMQRQVLVKKVPPNTIAVENGPTVMIQELEDSVCKLYNNELAATSTSPQSGWVVFVPDLRRLVEQHASLSLGGLRALSDWVLHPSTRTAGWPTTLLLIPSSGAESVRLTMHDSFMPYINLERPSLGQIQRWVSQQVDHKRIFSVRTRTEDKKSVGEKLAAHCHETGDGYLAVIAVKKILDRIPAPRTCGEVLNLLPSPAKGSESAVTTDVSTETDDEKRKDLDDLKNQLRPLAQKFFKLDKLITKAVLLGSLSIWATKQSARKGVPRPEPLLSPWPADQKQLIGPFRPGQPGSVAWVQVLFECAGVALPHWAMLGTSIVDRLKGDGRANKELAKAVGGRLRDFYQGTVNEKEKQTRRTRG